MYRNACYLNRLTKTAAASAAPRERQISMHRLASHPLQGGEHLRPESPPLGRGPDVNGPGIRALFVLAPILAFIVGIVRVVLEPTWTIGYLAASIALPAVIVAVLIIDVRRGWSRPAAAVLLGIEAVAAGAF